MKDEIIIKLAEILLEKFTEQGLDFMCDNFTIHDYLDALILTAPCQTADLPAQELSSKG